MARNHQPLALYSSSIMVAIVGLVHYLLTKPAERFREVFESSEAELPALTALLFPDSLYYWVIPGISLLLVALNALGRVPKNIAVSVSGLLTLGSIVLFVFAMYLPVYRLGSLVGP